jgi:prepilin-type N-terminal cleavage/methylation domain-containing protein
MVKKGMTLVEILIAVGLFTIVAIGINNFMVESRSTTKILLEKGDNLRETRLAIARLVKDIRSGHGLVQAVDNDEFTSFTIKRVLKIESDENDKVSYDVEQGEKGLSAANVVKL